MENREQNIIDELSAKYPVHLYGSIAKPEHLTQKELEQYANLYIKETRCTNVDKIKREILGYLEKAHENGLTMPASKRNLQPNGIYLEDGKIVIPGLAAIRDHKIVSYSQDVQTAYNNTRHLEPLITKDILHAVNDAGAECRGLENAVKTGSSMGDKIERDLEEKGMSISRVVNDFSDVVRYTAVANDKNLFSVARNTLAELKQNGYQLIRIKNYFEKPMKSGYRGLHFSFASPVRQTIELQFHTERSFMAKQNLHEFYEIARKVSTNAEEREILNEKMRVISSLVPNPSNMHIFHMEEHPVLFSDRAIIRTEQDNDIERFLVSFHGKPLFSGCEYVSKEGQVISARSDLQQNHTEIYICNEDGQTSAIAKEEAIVFDKEISQHIVDDILHSEVQNQLSR